MAAWTAKHPAGALHAPTVARRSQGDADLLRATAGGDLGALGVLYDRHHDEVRRFVVRASAGADAEDLVHETFLAAVDASKSFAGSATARSFLLGIAARLVSSRRRRLARWARAALSMEVNAEGNSLPTPEDRASAAEEVACFERALASLPEDKRLVFLLSESEGLPGAEIAQALGIPIATVWTRLHYARAELRAALMPGRCE